MDMTSEMEPVSLEVMKSRVSCLSVKNESTDTEKLTN